MLHVALKPMVGVISGFIKPGDVVSVGEESKHFNGVAVGKDNRTGLYVHRERIENGDLAPIDQAFKQYNVMNLTTGEEFMVFTISELEALDIVSECETGETIRSLGGFYEGRISYGVADFAVMKRESVSMVREL